MGRDAVAFKQRMKAAASRMSAIEGMDDLLAGLLDEGEDEEVEGEEGEEEQEEAEEEDFEEEPLDDVEALAQELLADQPEEKEEAMENSRAEDPDANSNKNSESQKAMASEDAGENQPPEQESPEDKPKRRRKKKKKVDAEDEEEEQWAETAEPKEAVEKEEADISAKSKKTSKASTRKSTEKATAEDVTLEEAEAEVDNPEKQKKTSKASTRKSTEKATAEDVTLEEAEAEVDNPEKQKKTSKASTRKSTEKATAEDVTLEEAEAEVDNPEKQKKTSKASTRHSAEKATAEDVTLEEAEAEVDNPEKQKKTSKASTRQSAEKATAEVALEEAEVEADKPAAAENRTSTSDSVTARGEAGKPDDIQEEHTSHGEDGKELQAEGSQRGSKTSGGKAEAQPTGPTDQEDIQASPQGPEVESEALEEEQEEMEEEAEVFDCEAGEDVKELGLMPTAFAPDPVEIASVTDGSWAATMGVQPGDMLLKINGTPVEAMDKKEMKRAMRERPLSLTLSRPVFATPEGSMDDVETFECIAAEGVQDLGLYPSAFPPEEMIISNVTAGSWAAQQGVQVGDELVEIGDKQVQDMVAKETKRAMRDRPLRLVFQRVISETPSPSTPAPSPPAASSAPASSAPSAKQRKSKKSQPDILTQAANEARKSLAAILPQGLNPLAPDASLGRKLLANCGHVTKCIHSTEFERGNGLDHAHVYSTMR